MVYSGPCFESGSGRARNVYACSDPDRMTEMVKICMVHFIAVFRIRKFLGLPDPDPLVRVTDPDPDSSIIKLK